MKYGGGSEMLKRVSTIILIMTFIISTFIITPAGSAAASSSNANSTYDGYWKGGSVGRIAYNVDNNLIRSGAHLDTALRAWMVIKNGKIESLTYVIDVTGDALTNSSITGNLMKDTYYKFKPVSIKGSYSNLVLGGSDEVQLSNGGESSDEPEYIEFTDAESAYVHINFFMSLQTSQAVNIFASGSMRFNMFKTDESSKPDFSDNPGDSGGSAPVSASPAPGPKDVNTLWVNILPDKDPALSDSLACLNDMVWNGKGYIIAGRGKILSSQDSKKWKATYTADNLYALYGVVWNGKEYVAVGAYEENNTSFILKSANGASWKEVKTERFNNLKDIAWNGKTYVAAGAGGTLIKSADGMKWARISVPSEDDFSSILWSGTLFLAVGNNVIATSPNGAGWNVITSQKGEFKGAVYYKGQYCIIDSKGKISITKDFKKWSSKQISMPSDTDIDIVNAACNKDTVQVAATNGYIFSSSDLATWKTEALKKGYGFNNVILVNGKFFAVGPGTVYTLP
jgi:hypothetical protein